MDLKKLRHSQALLEEGNFARAAKKLFITQSALSRSIQSLENELGMQLFERRTTGVKATEIGRQLLARAENLLRQANGFEREAKLLKEAHLGELAFGVGPVPAYLLMPQVLSDLFRSNPHLTVSAEVQSASRLMKWLLEEKIEFFIADTSQFTYGSEIRCQTLLSLSAALYIHSDHPLSQKTSVDVEELQNFPLASPGLDADIHNIDNRKNYFFGIEWSGRVISEDIRTLETLACETDVVLMMADAAIEGKVQQKRLKKLTIKNQITGMNFQTNIVTLADRTLSPAAQKVIELMQKYAEKIEINNS